MTGPNRQPFLTTVETSGRPVHVRAWRVMVGRVPLYLLDTNLEANHADDRGLMNKLYAGGPELRVRQEWILGVGGVRVLRAMGINPSVWHANEGHAAFMMIERLRELTTTGTPLDEAVKRVRAQGVFTTHTPVPAGHDAFSVEQLEAVRRPGLEGDGDRARGALPARRAPCPARPVPHDRLRHAALGPGERRAPPARAGEPRISGATSGPGGPGRRCRSGT